MAWLQSLYHQLGRSENICWPGEVLGLLQVPWRSKLRVVNQWFNIHTGLLGAASKWFRLRCRALTIYGSNHRLRCRVLPTLGSSLRQITGLTSRNLSTEVESSLRDNVKLLLDLSFSRVSFFFYPLSSC